MFVYGVVINKNEFLTDEANEALFYARKALKKGSKSIFIEVREMSEKEFETLEVI